MGQYTAPLRDMQFVLHELLGAEAELKAMPPHADIDADTINQVIEEAGKFCSDVVFPLNQVGDREGCTYVGDGVVKAPTGFKEAYQQYVEAGWPALACDPAFGGQGLPIVVNNVVYEMLNSANQAWTMYPGLSHGAYEALHAHGTPELQQAYLPKLVSGVWTGTMCLTEPHAGTDLGLIRTRAEPRADGSYAITGTKIFITGGEQDLTENIVHLVLARLPDAPAGPKGISLFLVPKVLVDDDGNLGERNAVSCGSIEHKMGIKASATCVMNFDGASGWLVGEANKGLAAMFTMMNYERLSIGIQGIGCAEASYQAAVAYARERIQSRAPTGPVAKDKPADPIIVHPDVRRMLLTMKAMTEGGRAFACFVGQQVFGGHGYIREWGQEQRVRDVRIAQIYEGTNGIQALDLLGRKVVGNGGATLRRFTGLIRAYAESPAAPYREALLGAVRRLEDVSAWLLDRAAQNPAEIGAASVDYLHLFGYVAYAWLWSRMAEVAERRQVEDEAFYGAKRATAAFFFQRLLPRTLALEAGIRAGSTSLYGLAADQF